MSIYHWKLGDIALATVSQQFYAKVRVVKDDNGLFYDDKFLGIAAKEDNSTEVIEELCYYVEIIRSGHKLWLPYTALRLAERSRPFYGTDKPLKVVTNIKTEPVSSKSVKKSSAIMKRKLVEDCTLPLDVKLPKLSETDSNITFGSHNPLDKQIKIKQSNFYIFLERAKDVMVDFFYKKLEEDKEKYFDSLDFLKNSDATTEQKYEEVLKHFVKENEVENHLRQCWRYNYMKRQEEFTDDALGSDAGNHNTTMCASQPPKAVISQHIPWCMVCGRRDDTVMRECTSCPVSYHQACREDWQLRLMHRKMSEVPFLSAAPSVSKKVAPRASAGAGAGARDRPTLDLCPCCVWGPKIAYSDLVWHKLGTYSWWPARVLSPAELPRCLAAQDRSLTRWPLRYYGHLDHSWAEATRMCLFLPVHVEQKRSNQPPMFEKAVLDACDDYITTYLK